MLTPIIFLPENDKGHLTVEAYQVQDLLLPKQHNSERPDQVGDQTHSNDRRLSYPGLLFTSRATEVPRREEFRLINH